MADLNDDIIKYHSGNLSAEDMHALERKALDDPFLAEALDGSSEISPEAFAEDIDALGASLNKRIHQVTENKPATLWTWPLRVAASVVLIISVSVIIFALVYEKESEQLALNEEVHSPVPEPAPQAAPPAAETVVSSPDENASGAVELKTESPRAEVRKSAPIVTPSPTTLSPLKGEPSSGIAATADELQEAKSAEPVQAEEDKLSLAKEEVAASQAPAWSTDKSDVAEKREAESEVQAPKSYAAKKQSDAESDRKRKSTGASRSQVSSDADISRKMIAGQVLDVSGVGLPGVNVLIKGTDIGTVTDATGNYQVTTNANDPTLVFSFIGYGSTEVETAGKKQVNVTLDEDVSQLSEVVVTGYGVPKDQEDVTAPLELASPVGGRKAFKLYLEKSLQYPERALENKVEGRVTIQFAVEPSGVLSDFRVIKGIGDGCNEEVIRLIKSGPKWNASKRENETLRSMIRVRMKFQLPKDTK